MISFERDDRWVELETFSSEDVVNYLDKALNENQEKKRFESLATSKWCKGILASFEGTSFIIFANLSTCIEFTFNVRDFEKMSEVIEVLKKWDKFSKTEFKFICDFEEGNTHITIFENGYVSTARYKSHFHKHKLSITKF